MIPFDPERLFPLLDPHSHTYKDAQDHSVLVDLHLDFQYQDIEENLRQSRHYQKDHESVQAWQGLPVQALQTPYTEIRYILSLLNTQENQTVIDLGCGYGRMAHVIGQHYPQVEFVGYELVDERVREGQRILKDRDYPNVRLETRDLSDPGFAPPVADFYFIFDFGSRAALEKTLEDLRRIAQTKNIVVVARGRGIRHQIYQSHPWLCQVQEPETYDHFTIFRS